MTLVQVPQLVPGVWTSSSDCGPAAGAVQVRFVTNGEDTPTAADVRALVRTPAGNQDNGPTNIPQVARAINRGWGVTSDLVSPGWFDGAWDRLRDPRESMHVMIWYGTVRGTSFYASRSGFGENHSVVLAAATDSSIEVADSLADGRLGVPKGPQRWPRDLVRRACGAVRVNRGGSVGLLGNGFVIGGFATAQVQPQEGEPMIDLVPMTLRRTVRVPAGVKLLRRPDGATHSTVAKAVSLGLIGAPSAEWYCVASGDRGVYVRRDEVGKPVVATVSVGK